MKRLVIALSVLLALAVPAAATPVQLIDGGCGCGPDLGLSVWWWGGPTFHERWYHLTDVWVNDDASPAMITGTATLFHSSDPTVTATAITVNWATDTPWAALLVGGQPHGTATFTSADAVNIFGKLTVGPLVIQQDWAWRPDGSFANWALKPGNTYGADIYAVPVVGIDQRSVPIPTPEPGSLVLLGSGLIGLARWARRRYAQ